MTTAHPRDPRLRRQHGGPFHPVDASAAAVRLEIAADAMRAALTVPEPEPSPELVDGFDAIAAEHIATAVQLGTVGPPLTAQEFADALDLGDVVEEFPGPAPVAPLPPVDEAPASAPAAFDSERSLTWSSRHDPRSLEYGVRALLAGSAPLTDHLWPVGPVLDQGAEGACVGFAIVDAMRASGHGDPAALTAAALTADAERIYRRAQQLDEVPGEDYSGTSVLAGMQAAVEAGFFGGYRWAFGTRDVAQAVLQVGPVVIGVPWLSGMYDTGPGGLVTLTGNDQGLGHCLAVVGIRLKGPQGQPGPFFVWQNSWGPTYGDGGLGYIHHRDLAELLHGTGEAAIPMPGPQHV